MDANLVYATVAVVAVSIWSWCFGVAMALNAVRRKIDKDRKG